jgi:hypothetical protein
VSNAENRSSNDEVLRLVDPESLVDVALEAASDAF